MQLLKERDEAIELDLNEERNDKQNQLYDDDEDLFDAKPDKGTRQFITVIE